MQWAEMRPRVRLVTAPTAEPLTYAGVKALLQARDDTAQEWLTAEIVNARQQVERDIEQLLITQTWDVTFDEFPTDAITIPLSPLQSVTSVTVTNSAGVSSVLSSSTYVVDTTSGQIVRRSGYDWPTDLREVGAIVIRVVVGFAASAAALRVVAAPLVHAMEQLVAVSYCNRAGTVYAAPPSWLGGYDKSIASYRRVGLA